MSSSQIDKLYCYVDETGQDTQGRLFIVSAVIVTDDLHRDQAMQVCEAIEHQTAKGRRKWTRTRPEQRVAYLQRICQESLFHSRLYFCIYSNTTDYLSTTIQTITLATQAQVQGEYKLTVLIDGLPRSMQRTVGSHLRQAGLQVRKVRGVKEENDALSRLADAICGWVRAGLDTQQTPYTTLLQQAQTQGLITQLDPKKKNPLG